MESTKKLYDSISDNRDLFKKYLEAQAFTIDGKNAIAEAIVQSLNTNLNEMIVGIIPCDIGIYFKILSAHFPKAQFILVDKSVNALHHISTTMNTKRARLYNSAIENLKGNVDEKMHLILSIFGTHLFRDISLFFNQTQEILLPKCKLVLITMIPEQESIHPMGSFFNPEEKNDRFLPFDSIIKKAELCNLRLHSHREIEFVQTLNKTDIPIAFSRYANSFLFSQPPDKVIDFQKYLCSWSKGNFVELTYKWTMIILKGE